jgi:hypothetical protein
LGAESTRLEGINLRGVFRFPVEHYAAQLLPYVAEEPHSYSQTVHEGVERIGAFFSL